MCNSESQPRQARNTQDVASVHPLNPQAEAIIAKVADAIRDQGCGATLNGKTVFCDNPGLKDHRNSECVCKTEARAAVAAFITALQGTDLPYEFKSRLLEMFEGGAE